MNRSKTQKTENTTGNLSMSPVERIKPEQFDIGSINNATKKRFMVRIGELSSGSEIAIPVIVVKGKKDGTKSLITSGAHADEPGCIRAVKQFAAQIKPEDVSGTVIFVPLQNVPAWACRSRFFPLDAPNPIDLGMGGLLKGDPSGVMSKRVLAAIADHIALDVEYAFDVHAVHLDSVYYPFSSVLSAGDEPPEIEKKRKELAYKLGNEIIWMEKSPSNRGGLRWILVQRGCVVLHMETGEGFRTLEPFHSILMRGINNFCKAVGILDGKPELPALQIETRDRLQIYANHGGLLEIYVQPGQYVKKNQLLAEVRDMFDDIVDQALAPANGIVMMCALMPNVATGGRICAILPTDLEKEWKQRTIPPFESLIKINNIQRY